MNGDFSVQDWLTAAALFGLLLSISYLPVVLIMRRQVERREALEHRLGVTDGVRVGQRVLRLWRNGEEVTATIATKSRLDDWVAQLERLPQRAGISIPVRSMMLLALGLTLLAFVIAFALTTNWLAGAGTGALTLIALWIGLKQRIAWQVSRFERQFVDALSLIARSLRAGHPLVGAFHLVAEELDPPVSDVFAGVCEQQALGIGLDQALRDMAASSTSEDVKLFAASVTIQLRSGGNLADMMDRLANVIRDRIRLNQRVRVLTAQTQFSKRVLLLMPILIFVLLNMINGSYMRPLYVTHVGHLLIAGAVISMALGAWMMNRMARLRY